LLDTMDRFVIDRAVQSRHRHEGPSHRRSASPRESSELEYAGLTKS
jgi:hypothetical protein